MLHKEELRKTIDEIVQLDPNHQGPAYVIHTIERHCGDNDVDNIGMPNCGAVEPVGWYPTLDEAVQTVENNLCDLSEEGGYQAAFISAIFPGLYHFSISDRRLYYTYDKSTNTFQQTEEPKCMRHFAY